MNQFKNDGLLHVPTRHDPDASLESVDLDDPDPDGNTLEAFLNEPDVLYDVSPLPKDDTPIQKLENIANTPTTVSNVDEISPPNPASYASGVVSRKSQCILLQMQLLKNCQKLVWNEFHTCKTLLLF